MTSSRSQAAATASQSGGGVPVPRHARPVFLDPLKVHLPVTATVSLAHRISGMLLVLALPFTVYLLDRSLSPPADLSGWLAMLQRWPGRVGLLLLVWSLAHHTAAGVRHLLFDAGLGTGYRHARRSAWAVHALAAAATLAALLGMLPGVRG